jgi:signal transduction histidine kinase
LRQLIGSLEQQARLAHLEPAITASIEYSQQIIATRRDRGFDAAAQMIATGHGIELITRVRALLHEMEAAEKELLDLRRAKSEAIRRLTLLILPSAVFISVLLLTFVVLWLNVEAASKQRLIAESHHHAELLEVANKELEGFSYSVSHDLRAPLRAIDGFSRIIAEDLGERLDDDSRRMLNVIRSEAQRMSRLIDDLLAFSRLGRQQVVPEPIDMHALAQEVFDELAALAPGRQLHLVLHPLPPAIGTPSMVRQAWVNLLSNAIKFTHGREPGVIEIGTQVGELGAPIYYVKDNGAGFDMRYADKLFGVFQRLHSGEKFEGTGIGLSLVKRIVERHGGRVWAEAEVDHGATFYFTLPNPLNPKSADPMHAQPDQHHE